MQTALLLAACLLSLGALPLRAQQAEPVRVEIITATAAPVERRFETTGEVVARDTVGLSFPTGGRVLDVLVEDGAHVTAGHVLARIDPIQQQQALRAAQAAYATAEASLRQAADDFERQEALLAQGASTRTGRDEAEARARMAEARVEQARADVEVAEEALADTDLTASRAGQIISRDVEPGQVVAGAQTVFELASELAFDVLVDLPEIWLTQPEAVHLPVTMRLLNGARPPFTGRISEISPQVDPTTGTVQAVVEVEGTPEGLFDGAAVRGGLSITEAPRISLPAWALTGDANGPAVWVVDPGTNRVSLRSVTVLRHLDTLVVLSDGLSDGEQVVGRGAHLMFPGRPVAAVEVP